ncbi:MAG: hypothetical protein A3I20_03350 [Candidatus Portnoybacteria bacterium RIFCSPLOWO2_02_FULL_40_15]|uniref:Uncharacterized protein n=1 Tax=Candidatus Portnoybacteria bacterium RIFCSPLOWO2_02_FULL_40_15 TaxID=1802002 RepID=A0A1G2FQY1_9BACT|nr:MAG: hypothetical protein A3I20_03350 [Candidatus Portnoybacteria bacterium RIFCSPLOWO2_02_FULL_40_15]
MSILRNYFRFFTLFFIVVLVILILGLPLSIVKADAVSDTWSIPKIIRADTFTEVFLLIADWVAGIVATLAVLVIMIGGIQYMASGGNEKKIEGARKTIQWSVIGLGIVLLSWSLLNELTKILGVEPPPSGKLPTLPIETVIIRTINWIAGIIAIVAVLVVLVSGVVWMTAGGEEERVKTARKWLTAGLIGLAVSLAAVIIVNVVLGLFKIA